MGGYDFDPNSRQPFIAFTTQPPLAGHGGDDLLYYTYLFNKFELGMPLCRWCGAFRTVAHIGASVVSAVQSAREIGRRKNYSVPPKHLCSSQQFLISCIVLRCSGPAGAAARSGALGLEMLRQTPT